MASNPTPLQRDTGGRAAKDDPPKPTPGTADKPAGKPAQKGPLDRPEKS